MRKALLVLLAASVSACNHSNGAAVCADTQIQTDILIQIVGDGDPWTDDVRLFRSHGGKFAPFKNMSVSGRNDEINETTCSGTVSSGDDAVPVSYKVRPGTDGGSVWELANSDGNVKQNLFRAAIHEIIAFNRAHGLWTHNDRILAASEQQQNEMDASAKASVVPSERSSADTGPVENVDENLSTHNYE